MSLLHDSAMAYYKLGLHNLASKDGLSQLSMSRKLFRKIKGTLEHAQQEVSLENYASASHEGTPKRTRIVDASPEETLEKAVKNQIMKRRQTLGGEQIDSMMKAISLGSGIGMHADMETVHTPQLSPMINRPSRSQSIAEDILTSD